MQTYSKKVYLFFLTSLLLVACDPFGGPQLQAQLTASPAIGEAPLEVSFDITGSSQGQLSFNPGDGSPRISVTTNNFKYVYTKEGSYQPSLTVIADALQATDSADIVVHTPSKIVNLPELEENVWTQFKPGGDTICSDGTEYSYYATPGKLNKLVLDFQGGGACWDDFSCSRGPTGTYARNVLWMSPKTFETGDINGDGIRDVGGLYDRDHLQNPVKDWYHVYLPYCSADVGWGNSIHTYTEISGPDKGKPNVIHHKGTANISARP